MRGENPERIGEFEIVRELGRGGMGVVYEARQPSLKRSVALKILTGFSLPPKAVARFQREAEAAARLRHANIVSVYATGEEDGVHYYAMEFIDGPSLDSVIEHLRRTPADSLVWKDSAASVDKSADGTSALETDLARVETVLQLLRTEIGSTMPAELPRSEKGENEDGVSRGDTGKNPRDESAPPRHLPSARSYFTEVAGAFADVAEALEHAHRQGVIHRDVKPANLLVAPDGRLCLNDFGVARILEEPRMTLTGEIVGSPTYMSPEQVAAGHAPLDHRSDIYSLGATLYELLTLRRAFGGTQWDEVLAQITHTEPKPPRQVNPNVPVDLETICLKALAKEPKARYQSAREMADDLRRYAEGVPIAARRAGPLARAARWTRRHRPVAGLAIALVVVLLAAGFLLYRAEKTARAELDQVISQLEGQAREVFARRHAIVAACGLREGMDVADIGAGTGLFTRLFSLRVGSNGTVYAVDIERVMVEHIERTSREQRLRNIVGVVCTATSVELEPNSVDVAFISDTYRYFEEPEKTIASLGQALRSGGRLIIIDLRPQTSGASDDGAETHDRVSEERVRREIESFGFRFVGAETVLDESYFLRFEKR